MKQPQFPAHAKEQCRIFKRLENISCGNWQKNETSQVTTAASKYSDRWLPRSAGHFGKRSSISRSTSNCCFCSLLSERNDRHGRGTSPLACRSDRRREICSWPARDCSAVAVEILHAMAMASCMNLGPFLQSPVICVFCIRDSLVNDSA